MIKLLAHKENFISAPLSSVSTLLAVDASFLAYVVANVNFGAGDYFYLTLTEDNKREEVKVTGSGVGTLVIAREFGDTTAQSFTIAARYYTDLNKAATEDIAAGTVPVATISIAGTGAAEVADLGGGNFTVNVDVPNITGVSGIETTQAFPDYQVALINGGGCCEGDTPTTTTITMVGEGIAEVTQLGDEFTVTVPPPNFTGVGVSVSGTYPDLEITVAAPGTGTVIDIDVENGLYSTGDPAVHPTIGMSPSGVDPGTYGDVIVNDRGQITSLPAGFDPISSIVDGLGIDVSRTGSEVTIAATAAAEGVVGVVALADADAPLDDTDITTAVTPKLLASVVADLEGATLQGGHSYSGEADADYTYTVPTTAIVLVLAAGESALVFVNLLIKDTGTPTDPVNYGMALFATTSGARIQSNKKNTQNEQNMLVKIDGPFNDGILLKTTTLAGAAGVISQSVMAVKF